MISPFIKIYKMSRQWRNVFEEARRRTRGTADNRGRTRNTTPKKRKKKIDPSVGEYVEFTETVCMEQTPPREPPAIKVEQQITDITWEDIP